MTATDLHEWQAFYAELPDRSEYYALQLLSLVANAAFKPKGGKPFAPADFLPDLRTPAERARAEAELEQARAQFEEMRRRAAAEANGEDRG